MIQEAGRRLEIWMKGPRAFSVVNSTRLNTPYGSIAFETLTPREIRENDRVTNEAKACILRSNCLDSFRRRMLGRIVSSR